MKKSELKSIIKEEIVSILKEGYTGSTKQRVTGDELKKFQSKYPNISDNYADDAEKWFKSNKSKYKQRDDMYSAYMKEKGFK